MNVLFCIFLYFPQTKASRVKPTNTSVNIGDRAADMTTKHLSNIDISHHPKVCGRTDALLTGSHVQVMFVIQDDWLFVQMLYIVWTV